jgi:hypothetical protein
VDKAEYLTHFLSVDRANSNENNQTIHYRPMGTELKRETKQPAIVKRTNKCYASEHRQFFNPELFLKITTFVPKNLKIL